MTRALASVFTVLLLIATFFAPARVAAQDRIGIGFNVNDDGGCEIIGKTLIAEYERHQDDFNARGRVRTAPSSGDCRQESFVYDVEIARHFHMTGDWDVMAEFGANQHTTTAAYGPRMDWRPMDWRPEEAPWYPAGAARTVTAVMGVSKAINDLRVSAGFNFAPINWSDGTATRTVQLGASYVTDRVSVDADVNHWRSRYFSEASVSYRIPVQDGTDLSLSVTHSRGLNAIDGGERPEQMVNGVWWELLPGAPRNHSTLVAATFGFSLQ